MTRKASRRDFLQGKAAARAVADSAQKALPGDDTETWPSETTEEGYLIRVSRRAMATEFEVVLNAGQYEGGTEASLDALDLIEALEDQMSVFRPNSEISRMNRTCAHGPVEVEPRLFGLLELAEALHAETGGALDITSSPLWKVWGFRRRAGSIPSDDELSQAMKNVGSHLVELDAGRKTVLFRQPGVELNLGSIGKGYALDRCAEVLIAAGIHDFLIHGGQSSVLARGSQGSGLRGQGLGDRGQGLGDRSQGSEVRVQGSGFRVQGSEFTQERGTRSAEPRTLNPEPLSASDPQPKGWIVGIPHPTRKDVRLAELRLRDRALGTSGASTQYFRYRGQRYGHILDPRSGRPAEGVFSATVLAATAAQADALSTAFYVMGAGKALQYCRSRPEIGAVLVCLAHDPKGFEIRSAGLGDDELRILDDGA